MRKDPPVDQDYMNCLHLLNIASLDGANIINNPNAIKIFNEKEADELLVLDIDATVEGNRPNYDLIANFAVECRMPLCYGGGIRTAEDALRLIDLGVEKVAISAAAISNPDLVTQIAAITGRQSVVAAIDIRKRRGLFAKGYEVVSHNSKKVHKLDPIILAKNLQDAGAGEIVINCIDNDGVMQGYNLPLIEDIRKK